MGFIREQFGRITVESRRESFMIHVEEASLREPSSEWWTADLGDLIAALTDYRDSLAARDTRAALAGVSAEATPEGCRAPHCWSEYGTPCGTCPVVAEAAPDEPTEDPLDPHDGPAPLTAEDRAAAMPPIVAPPPNPYRTLHARMSPPGAAWDEGFAAGLAARDTNEPKDGKDA